MPTRPRKRIVTFDVIDDHLEMKVTFTDAPDDRGRGYFRGRDYVHRCTRDIYREVAFTIEEQAADGTTLEGLVAAMDAPFTQVNVALAFLKERGCVEVRRRRTYPASVAMYEDAMVEFTYLADAPY